MNARNGDTDDEATHESCIAATATLTASSSVCTKSEEGLQSDNIKGNALQIKESPSVDQSACVTSHTDDLPQRLSASSCTPNDHRMSSRTSSPSQTRPISDSPASSIRSANPCGSLRPPANCTKEKALSSPPGSRNESPSPRQSRTANTSSHRRQCRVDTLPDSRHSSQPRRRERCRSASRSMSRSRRRRDGNSRDSGGRRKNVEGGGSREERVGEKRTLLVRNIGHDVSSDEFKRTFERFGEVRDVYMPRNYHTKQPRGFGFVEFFDGRDASDVSNGTTIS
eukprot:GHVQ01012978.1.p1 GENE.GHVQ01012978.1~~GHVQ01012978.1.p1  ORF type:complete len:282 (+),score=62.73 GHVQ01012978.1:352-1197(+)